MFQSIPRDAVLTQLPEVGREGRVGVGGYFDGMGKGWVDSKDRGRVCKVEGVARGRGY